MVARRRGIEGREIEKFRKRGSELEGADDGFCVRRRAYVCLQGVDTCIAEPCAWLKTSIAQAGKVSVSECTINRITSYILQGSQQYLHQTSANKSMDNNIAIESDTLFLHHPHCSHLSHTQTSFHPPNPHRSPKTTEALPPFPAATADTAPNASSLHNCTYSPKREHDASTTSPEHHGYNKKLDRVRLTHLVSSRLIPSLAATGSLVTL